MQSRDLTLVIPTFNRSDLLARLLKHLANCHWKSPIIVADSSDVETTARNKAAIGRYRTVLGIKHVCFPSYTSPGLKLAHTVSQVESEYVVLCADDDIIVPATVNECVTFLSRSPEYSLCHGVFLSYLHKITADGSTKILMTSDNISDSIEQDSASGRLMAQYHRYATTFYGVRRTALLNEILTRTCECLPGPFGNGCLLEVFEASLVVINGKVKRLPYLYCVRKGWPSTVGFEGLVTRRDFSTNLDAVREFIVKELVKREAISTEDAHRFFDAAFMQFLRGGLGELPLPDRFKEYHATPSGSRQLEQRFIDMVVKSAGADFEKINELLQSELRPGEARLPVEV